MERETFTAYEFVGMYVACNSEERSISLKCFLEHEFVGVYDTKGIFEHPYALFESKEMSLEDIHKAIAEGTVFFPITVSCSKKDVLEYIEKGFKVRFMKFMDYKHMLKVYEG